MSKTQAFGAFSLIMIGLFCILKSLREMDALPLYIDMYNHFMSENAFSDMMIDKDHFVKR